MPKNIEIPSFDEKGNFPFRKLNLLDLSDEEIDLVACIPCFDIDAAAEKFRSLDDWSLVLHAHLYMDHILYRMLHDEAADGDALDEMQLSFDTKLKLCRSFGLMGNEDLPAFRKFNSLRNKLSHTLFNDFSDRNFEDIINCSSEKIKNNVSHVESQQPNYRSTKFLSLCGVLVMHLETQRQNNMLIRLRKSKALERLRGFIIKE